MPNTAQTRQIQIETALDDQQLQEAWDLYSASFDELRSRAAQRHVMVRDEFDDMMGDARVLKFLARDDEDDLRGLSTYTNDLDALHLISPDYFARRWPEQFAARTIWYVGFVGIHPGERHTGLYDQLIAEMTARHRGKSSVVGMDVCGRNLKLGFPQGTLKIVQRQYDNVELEHVDDQSYWIFDFTEASPRATS